MTFLTQFLTLTFDFSIEMSVTRDSDFWLCVTFFCDFLTSESKSRNFYNCSHIQVQIIYMMFAHIFWRFRTLKYIKWQWKYQFWQNNVSFGVFYWTAWFYDSCFLKVTFLQRDFLKWQWLVTLTFDSTMTFLRDSDFWLMTLKSKSDWLSRFLEIIRIY